MLKVSTALPCQLLQHSQVPASVPRLHLAQKLVQLFKDRQRGWVDFKGQPRDCLFCLLELPPDVVANLVAPR
eukprot:1879985-Pleurochrysis_carterae.AAC.1